VGASCGGTRPGSCRSGETIDDALAASRALGVGTVLTQLGENWGAHEADDVTRHYLDVLERVKAGSSTSRSRSSFTQLASISPEACERTSTP
jgi:hypothetical protein